MLKYAFKSLGVKKVKALLLMISIVISSCVALLAYNISGQINDGIIKTAAHYDIIIGPSKRYTTPMNTLFFTETPLAQYRMRSSRSLRKAECAIPWFRSAWATATIPRALSGLYPISPIRAYPRANCSARRGIHLRSRLRYREEKRSVGRR